MDRQFLAFDGVISKWTVMLKQRGLDLTKAGCLWTVNLPLSFCHAIELVHRRVPDLINSAEEWDAVLGLLPFSPLFYTTTRPVPLLTADAFRPPLSGGLSQAVGGESEFFCPSFCFDWSAHFISLEVDHQVKSVGSFSAQMHTITKKKGEICFLLSLSSNSDPVRGKSL